MTARCSTASLRMYARVAGALYLLVIVIALLNTAIVDSRLIVAGDGLETARNIIANELLFRTGVVAILLMYASVVVLAVALYVVLKTIDESLALMAMLLRTAEAVLGGTTALFSFFTLVLLKGDGGSGEFTPGHAQALAGLFLDVRTAGLDIVLIFVGLGGTVFCYLFYRSGYVPRTLSVWGIFTYLSMLTLAVVSIVFPEHPVVLETVLYGLGGVFELLFGAWLLFKGVDLSGAHKLGNG
jgi:hypothetical protein